MGPPPEDPLDELYADSDGYDRKRLAKTLNEYVQLGSDSGEAQFASPFYDLETEPKAVVVLLYRRAAHDLGELETPGMMDSWFEEDFEIEMRKARNICEDLTFVTEADESYRIEPINVGAALDWFEER